jgi:carbamoyl-phosphate synthase large subunit
MKSTGEVIGRDRTLSKALYKALIASGMKLPHHGNVVVTVASKDKEEVLPIAKGFDALGFNLFATTGTAQFLTEHGLRVTSLNKIEQGSPNILEMIQSGEAQYVINTMTKGKGSTRDGFQIRRAAVERDMVCVTSLDTAKVLLQVLESMSFSMEAWENGKDNSFLKSEMDRNQQSFLL